MRPRRRSRAAIERGIGLHTGEAIRDKDDFYGRNVTLAHRITDRGTGGQVLVSERLRGLLRRSRGVRFDVGVEVELKGLAGKHRMFAVRWD